MNENESKAADNRKVVIELRDVKRDFQVGDETVHALRGVSFKVHAPQPAGLSRHPDEW